MPVSGGEAVRLTQAGGFKALEAPDGANLHYTNGPGAVPATLWRVSTSGGEPVKIVEGIIRRAFVVPDRGICYIDLPPGEVRDIGVTSSRSRLQFLDFATGRSTSEYTICCPRRSQRTSSAALSTLK